jgi:F-type H+-transporting ATPase subunit a
MHSPVEQFTIKSLMQLELFGYDVSFSNSALFMMLAVIVSTLFLTFAMRGRNMVPGRMQGAAEMMYEFISDMVSGTVGSEGRPYFPFIFTLFVFLLFGNMLGLIPYSYTFTSQIVVTFVLALFIFIGVTLIAIFKHGTHFLTFFVPPGAPKVLIPFLIIIEVVSYFVRPVSLSVRLFANMLAWSYHAESVCWSGRDDQRCWRGLCTGCYFAISCLGWPDRTGSPGRRASGICVHYSDLHVS